MRLLVVTTLLVLKLYIFYVKATVEIYEQKRISQYPIPHKSVEKGGDRETDSVFHGCQPVGLRWNKGSYPYVATRLDPYLSLCTDAWGGFAASSASHEQVQCLSYTAGALAWKAQFDISSISPKQDNQVKSYPNVVWNRFPVQVKNLRQFYTEWDWFLFKQSSRIVVDVSYDIFLTRSPSCQDLKCASQEIMIWLGVTGEANPLGTRRGSVRINHGMFDVWQGFGFVPVVTLVPSNRNQAHHAFSANLIPLIQRSLGRYGLSQDQFVLSVGAGIEIFQGKGTLITKRYKLILN